MSRLLPAVFVLIAAARPAAAQVYLGAELGPGALLKAEEAKLSRENDDAFARVFVLDNSTASLCSVFGSTVPEVAVSAFLRRGIYRVELLVLFSIAGSTGVPFAVLAKEREKGASLRALAGRYGADLLKLFKEAEAKQKALEDKAAVLEDLLIPAVSTAPAAGAAAAAENEKK